MADETAEAYRRLADYSQKVGQVARSFREKRGSDRAKAGAVEPEKKIHLPAKMTISVTKQQLDDVASGKISFEEFKKQAVVHYLSFEQPKEKVGGGGAGSAAPAAGGTTGARTTGGNLDNGGGLLPQAQPGGKQ